MRGLLKRFQTISLMPEWLLVKRAKLGEKEAFGKLYEIYLDAMFRYIFYRVGNNRELSEDLVQSVFVKAWEKLDTFQKGPSADSQGSFKAWLYAIARNTVIDYFRSAKQTIVMEEDVIDEKQTVEEDVLQKVEVERVIDALHFLTDEQRDIVILKFVEDMSNKEIAHVLGKKEDAIRALQYRAIQELKKILNS